MAQTFSWQRAVIKVGSTLIAPQGTQCSGQYLLPIAHFITASRAQGKEVVLVSSGSVAAGRNDIKVRHQPSIAEKQAMAAIGQTKMMANWSRFFDFPCAQLLLTYDDIHHRTRYVNIKNTIRELLQHGTLPIINENDTVAVNELKVGDNDNLSAYAALLAQADTLIMCSDIDGLFDQDPRKTPDAKKLDLVEHISDETFALAGGVGSALGTGGMVTKLQAAQKCTESGIQTLIVNGQSADVFEKLLQGECPGTFFKPTENRHSARRQWLKHTLKSAGVIAVDSGAEKAIVETGASLLPSGIKEVSGHFKAGDAVLVEVNGQPFAKGLSLFASDELNAIKGAKSAQAAKILGYRLSEAAIHRDDLVLL